MPGAAGGNWLSWTEQVLIVASLASFLPAVLRLRHPQTQLAFYHAVLVLCLLLPLVQPWRHPVLLVENRSLTPAIEPATSRPEETLPKATAPEENPPVHSRENGSSASCPFLCLAKDAVKAAALDRAASYANELLQAANQHPQDWNYGNAIHDGNMVLGLVALRRGDMAQANRYLLEAGKTQGSPQLNSFGPNMTLAKELIDKGERDAVVEYFSLCRKFWSLGADRLDAWTATVRAGRDPEFGANLVF